MLAVAAAGVSRLVLNGGKMRLLCGTDLSEDDVEAIRRGEELAAKVATRMKLRLFWPEDKLIQDRLEAMAWMVATGQLEIKVVLPTDGDGRPLPANKTEHYYHPKEGLFLDAEGNSVGFSGSVNESATALEDNYESFMVFNTWENSAAHLAQIRHRFDRLLGGQGAGLDRPAYPGSGETGAAQVPAGHAPDTGAWGGRTAPGNRGAG
jgi:hypothetical protein